jgi:hypothetical protein
VDCAPSVRARARVGTLLVRLVYISGTLGVVKIMCSVAVVAVVVVV